MSTDQTVNATARKHLDVKWPSVPCSVNINCNGLTASQKSAVRSAMNTWNRVKQVDGTSLVTFNVASSNSSTDSSLEIHSVPYAKWVGHCEHDEIGGEIIAVHIELNSNYYLVVGKASNSYDIQSIATHELGHALGVAHCHEDSSGSEFISPLLSNSGECISPTCSNNAMNPIAIANSTARRTLQEYDTASYQYIYY